MKLQLISFTCQYLARAGAVQHSPPIGGCVNAPLDKAKLSKVSFTSRYPGVGAINYSWHLNSDNLYSEKELFVLVGDGDEAAFKELYRRLQPILIGFITKLLRSDGDAMEIVQESLLRLWMNRDKLAALEYPRTWLLRIVTNECYRYFRKHGLQDRLLSTLAQQSSDSLADSATERELSYRETRQLISDAVLSLSPRQREIYVLSRNQGLNTAAIAQQLHVSPKYVKKTLAVALGIIRKKLVKSGKFILLVLWWCWH